MTQRMRLVAAIALALPLAACAAQPGIVPGGMHEVKAHPLPPFQIHEECVKLEPGDRLDYAFTATAPVHFNIHYHEGSAVIMPVTRDKVMAESGRFEAVVAQEYCLMWEAGAAGTPLDYSVRFTRAKP
jgi:hypothetical protein